ncbi:acetyl-CoA hydrolase/transferase family protein [Cumulibacter manganitolerans]|uniref:acetyl-CoA hydrolase/transferase family protein n=1 Tax=Cumulibacter manganitolerans TaxID=1884992 RepID=UPI0012975A4B|nr:acetyl-CoA hydrolase/transferase C-terminal domain-containing protein [Cumulibacter manganitolerans]
MLRDRATEPRELDAGDLDLTGIVRPGDTLVWGQGTAEPTALTNALVAQRAGIVGDGERLNIFLGVTRGGTLTVEHTDCFRYFGLGGLGETSRLSKVGAIDVLPIRLGSVTQLIRQGLLRFDVVFVQLSEPRDGVCSTGLIGDMLQEVIRRARVVVGEVNPNVPFTHGDTQVAWSDLDVVVRSDGPLMQWPAARQSDEARRIAELIAERVPDAATIQLGIGAVPEAMASALHGKRDLGVHSGMITDAVLDMIEAGVVTNARKPIDPGVTVTGLVFGSDRLARWADDNRELGVRCLDHTHGVRALSAFDDFWAINSAIEVDLYGQVNAELMGGAYAGGIGGQLDYVRAAMTSDRGRSIIAFPAAAAKGTVSRIVSRLADGVVTTPRADADLFVTEHGVADLRGVPLGERPARLIAIAHPDHREALSQSVAQQSR